MVKCLSMERRRYGILARIFFILSLLPFAASCTKSITTPSLSTTIPPSTPTTEPTSLPESTGICEGAPESGKRIVNQGDSVLDLALGILNQSYAYLQNCVPFVVVRGVNDPEGHASSFNPNDLLTGRVNPPLVPGDTVCAGSDPAATMDECLK